MMYQPNPYQQRYTQPMNNRITWVQGVEGAKAFQLMPNSNTILLDSENDGIFYIKTSDNVGMCNLRVFKYEEAHDTPTPQIDTSQFVTRQELQDIIASLKGVDDEQVISTTKSRTKKLITE